MSDLLERVAGAPITWGVDGSPGWGYLMDRERVLREMVESGLSATELGPDGYLPTDPGELKEFLDRFDMSIVGGFVPALPWVGPGSGSPAIVAGPSAPSSASSRWMKGTRQRALATTRPTATESMQMNHCPALSSSRSKNARAGSRARIAA